jgi:hypothetical protein
MGRQTEFKEPLAIALEFQNRIDLKHLCVERGVDEEGN